VLLDLGQGAILIVLEALAELLELIG